MMDSPPKLIGETLIVHHIPLVHCQVPDRECCSTSKRTNPFCLSELGAPRTSSLPEQDLLQTDSLVYSSLLQASDAKLAPVETPEDKESQQRDLAAPGANKRQNPFLLSDSEAQDLYDDDLGQKSFHLHNGQPAFRLHEVALPPFRLHDTNPVVKPWSTSSRLDVVEGQEDTLANGDIQKRSRPVPEFMELDEYSCHRGDPSSFSFEQEWANDADELIRSQEAARSRTCSCSSSELQRCRCYSLSSQSEPLDQQMGYVSDSSCNSSDGVLVNFSALYNKANGHARPNLNSSNLSCDSSSGSHSDSGAFYLDLHSSPREPKMPCEPHCLEGSGGKACGCHHSSSPVLDANCNSYPPLCDPCASEGSDLTACFQSQARLVVATQNYYKLVTCDLSSQSSPSPAGSSITSCSEEHTRGSPVQPTEYYLFQRPDAQREESDTDCSREESQGEAERNAIEGQVYVNISPPTLAGGRLRSKSYDLHLDRSPSSRLGSLERMMSCPVKLSDSPALAIQSTPPKRVTSFAELAKGRKKNGGSPPLRASRDPSLEFCPIPEHQKDSAAFSDDRARHSQSLPPLSHALSRNCDSHHGSERERLSTSGKGLASKEMPSCGQDVPEQLRLSAVMEPGPNSAGSLGQKDLRARADGGVGDSKAVVRYSKDQRPTTLPIQPFVFQHHFPKQPKARALRSHFVSSLSQLYSRSASQQLSTTSQSSASASSADQPMVGGTLVHSQRSADGAAAASLNDVCAKKPVPETTRLSPLGSYSPVRSNVPFFQSEDSSSNSPTPESQPPRSRSCPISANLLPTKPSPATGTNLSGNPNVLHAREESSAPVAKKVVAAVLLPELDTSRSKCQLHPGSSLPPLLPAGLSLARAGGHSEPQWQVSCNEAVSAGLLGSVGPRPLNGHWLKQPQLNYTDFYPDYFSLAEKPPAEFCLSPDGNTESISIDLLQKKGLVKAINMAVDLIVAHFGTSRDPGVKAKLGNSSVSPNVGHLVLKYLCPAIQDVLSDGLKAYVLDVIIGQRRNIPWSMVEASTQLGPSTKVLHGLYSKVSQYPELTSHTMRFNAFIFGLLNIRSLEFWFNHLYNHEDIIQVHYRPVGFLPLAHGVCQGLFEEVLLLLQPLSLLPFSLDLLFEHHLLQVGREQQQQKELLRVQQGLVLSAHSTLQMMKSRGGGVGSWGAAEQSPSPEGQGQSLVEAAGRAKGLGAPSEREEGAERQKAPGAASELKRDKQASWWYQLMQSSQVYIEGSAEGSRSTRCERKKKAGLGAVAPWQAEPKKGPPPREGVVEGAEACPISEGPLRDRPPAEEAAAAAAAPAWKQDPSLARGGAKEKSPRPSWMGSPPDSVLTELKHPKEKEAGPTPNQAPLEESSPGAPDNAPPKWGHLFGSRKAPKELKPANRLPSGWLSLDRSVLQLMAQTVGATVWREAAPEPERLPAELPPSHPTQRRRQLDRGASPETPCEVKALCHHIATESGQLSFQKGDVLRVLGKADGDWLRCSRGAESGLVPVMYITHMEDEDY
ncbi:AP-4 complex accessory subunit RUSC2 isoform X2 [Rhineura floridana]|uniref:AP-4 complex accessory subunit RUSC2 isoform X2 n=1 Tax=Rhineura floridana TaxID=261503 RepID=UPI002AC84D97|nr:AP-4 complex accessory subunit RUSC2 isoform X2 [Rhineura floridana]